MGKQIVKQIINEINNDDTKYYSIVPCAAHSLNLVGEECVKVAIEIVNFFGVVQKIYVFFSSSTHRWELLHREMQLKFTLKSLSQPDGLVITRLSKL